MSTHPLLLDVKGAYFMYREYPLFAAARIERSSKTQQDIILSLINHGAGKVHSRTPRPRCVTSAPSPPSATQIQ